MGIPESEQLFNANVTLAHHVATQWHNTLPQIWHEDAHSEALLALWKACLAFDPSKGFTFSTFAVQVIRNQLTMLWRKIVKGVPPICSLEDLIPSTDNGLTVEDTLVASIQMDWEFLRPALTAVDPLLTQSILDDVPQTRIAQEQGVAQATICRRLQQAKRRARHSPEFVQAFQILETFVESCRGG